MSYQSLCLEKSGPVAILTMSRPEKLNAFNRQLTHGFHTAEPGAPAMPQRRRSW